MHNTRTITLVYTFLEIPCGIYPGGYHSIHTICQARFSKEKKNKKKITHLSSANVAFSVAMNLLAARQNVTWMK